MEEILGPSTVTAPTPHPDPSPGGAVSFSPVTIVEPVALGYRHGKHPRSLANLRHWPPGFAPNPGGRTKAVAELEARCREYMRTKGWGQLIALAQDRDKRARMWALEIMLNRGYGKPRETIDVTNRDATSRPLEDIADGLAELITRGQGAGSGLSIPSESNMGAGAVAILSAQSSPG